jgi:3-deoxy-D-manno-octulosonic-acid transferase
VRILYNIGLNLLPFFIAIGSLFSHKINLFYRGRRGLLKRVADEVKPGGPIIWFHCSSVGEFEQARPVIEWYKKNKPQYRVLVTFYSPSGYELRKNYNLADWIYYLPIDTPHNAHAFVKAVKPSKVIFIKYDLWYNFLREIKKSGAELYLASAIFRPFQPFFKWYGSFFCGMLRNFTKIFVQDEESKRNLEKINISGNVFVSGDTRFDRVHEITQHCKQFPVIENFVKEGFGVVAGSTWLPDEQIIADVLKNFSRVRLVVAPHEISKERIDKVSELFESYGVVKFSELVGGDVKNAAAADASKLSGKRVLIIDCLGILSSLYQYAEFAYIGGGFGVGIHNILEAATYGCPVVFGPNYKKFQEAIDLLKLEGATCIYDTNDFYEILDNCIKDKELREWKGSTCKTYVENHIGATEKIVSKIEGK